MTDTPERDGAAHSRPDDAVDDTPPYAESTTERQTLLVSIATDTDADSPLDEIGKHVGDGWRVVDAIAVSGDTSSPAIERDDVVRYQVTVERDVDAQGVIVDADRGGAADLKDVGQVSAAFGGPLPTADDPE